VDFNVVMTDAGEFVEVQGTAEDGTFSRARLDELMDLSAMGIARLTEIQRQRISEMSP
jgi:ribonuclease PH